MRLRLPGLVFALLLAIQPLRAVDDPKPSAHYDANWASLDTRPTPDWYADAKFGIFIHWWHLAAATAQ